MDIPELLNIVSFDHAAIEIQNPIPGQVRHYPTDAREFSLSEISVEKDRPFRKDDKFQMELLLCVSGEAEIAFSGSGERHLINRGDTALVPAVAPPYSLSGRCRIFRATIPPWDTGNQFLR